MICLARGRVGAPALWTLLWLVGQATALGASSPPGQPPWGAVWTDGGRSGLQGLAPAQLDSARILRRDLTGGLSAALRCEHKRLRQDLRHLRSKRTLSRSLAAAALVGAVWAADSELAGRWSTAAAYEGALAVATVYGRSLYSVPVAAAAWSVGHALDHPGLRAAASDAGRALLLTAAVVAPLKLAVRRQRPDRSDHLSFPSAHAASAVALSTVLARRLRPRHRIPMLVLAALVPVARVHDRRHFPSDVTAGAAIGVIVGLAVGPATADCRVYTVRPLAFCGGAGVQCAMPL
jgi:membrane-associated phospholipid phosphatase